MIDSTITHRRGKGHVRWALVVLVTVAGCYLAYGYGKLWAEWRETKRPAPTPRIAVSQLNPLAGALPLAGQWSFAELNGDVRTDFVTPAGIAARFEESASMPSAAGDANLPNVSPELLGFATGLLIKPIERAGNQVYRIDRADAKAQLVVRFGGSQPKLVALAAAFPERADRWRLYEFVPGSSAADSNATTSYLLPLPAGAKRTAGRFTDDGQLLLEFVTLDSQRDSLLAAWKESGWTVRPSGLGEASQFSYLCARGNEMIYAWSADPRASLQNLMLVRTPSSSDTNP